MGFFDDMMSAITFAEAGEHETAREILKERNKTVLLAVSDRKSGGSALKYALNITNRVKANLEILYVSSSDKEGVGIRDRISAIRKVGFRLSVAVKKGCMKKAILDYTEKRKDIIFIVIGSIPELDVGCKTADNSLPDVWKKLMCPLVVVSKAQEPLSA